ncbi:MAG: hypothetical protein WC629_02520, partial [Candidatus Paceibacterota bacterium]
WQTLSPEYGVVAGVVALNISGFPLLRSLWKHPDRQAFWMFAITAFACFLTLLVTWPWTIGGSLLSVSGIVYNFTLALLVLRKEK